MSPFRTFVLFALAAPCVAQAAITIDGQLDPDYGPPTIVQTLQTGLANGGQIPGDNTLADLNFASGSELDAAYVLFYGGTMRLFLTGNLALRLNQQGNDSRGHAVDIFIDSQPGGANTLMGLGSGNVLNGMTFDTGFFADYWFELYGHGDQNGVEWFAGRGTIEPQGGGGTFTSLGRGVAGGPGTLIGGTNPAGVKATIDNRNTGGVTFGCNASNGDGVTRGIEWEIPSSTFGSPTGCIRMTVIVRDIDTGSSSNSVLAPVPDGTCPMGQAQFVNFASIPGDQTFEVCASVLGVPSVPSGLRLALAGPNPARGERLQFEASAGTLELIDVTGRVVRRRAVDAAGRVDLSGGPRLAPGLYWARLTNGNERTIRRICIAG